MYCQKCGNQMPDNARFCSKCGFAVPAAKAAEQPVTPTAESTAAQGNPFAAPAAPKEKKPIPAKAIGIAAVAVVVILAAVLIIPMLGGGKNAFDMAEMYIPTVQGVDGYGALKVDTNYEAVYRWFCDALDIDMETAEQLIEDEYPSYNVMVLMDYYRLTYEEEMTEVTKEELGKAVKIEDADRALEWAEMILDLKPSADVSSGLNNGDIVTISFDYDEEEYAEAGLTLKNTEMEFTVEGLTGVATVDISPAMTMSVTGFDGYGILTYSLDAAKLNTLGLTPEQAEVLRNTTKVKSSQSKELKNGDSVIFTVEADAERLARAALLIEPTSWEYAVSGLTEMELIDPFEGLELSCDGISPYLEVELNLTGCSNIVQQIVDFTLPEELARNGEPVTVTASISPERAQEYGVALASETKEFILEAKPEFITGIDGVDMRAVLQEMDDFLQANSTSYNSIQRKASAFLYLKRQHEGEKHTPTWSFDRYIPYNAYCILYEAKNSSGNERGLTVMIRNLCKQNDGSITWDADLYWDYADSYDDIFEERITVQRDLYNVAIME